MVGLPGERQLLPRDALHPGDGPDGHALLLEQRALLDVQLDVGVRGRSGHRGVAGPPDALELLAEHGAVDGDDVERVLQRHAAGVHEAAEHVGGEPAALLVGEERNRQRAAGADAGVVEGAHDLQPREHAEGAVVAAPRADGVDVAARHDRVERGVGAGTGGDDVADAVDPDGEPEVPHPPDDQLAPAGVLVGEGEAAVAPVPRVAHRGEGVEVGQQPLPVDRRRRHPDGPPVTGGWADQGNTIQRSVSCQA